MGGEVHQCPGAPAQRPWLVVGRALQAGAGLGGTRGVEADPERLGNGGSFFKPPRLVAFLISACVPVCQSSGLWQLSNGYELDADAPRAVDRTGIDLASAATASRQYFSEMLGSLMPKLLDLFAAAEAVGDDNG